MKHTIAKALFVTALTSITAFSLPAQADRNSPYEHWNAPRHYEDTNRFDRRFTVTSRETLSIALKQNVRNRTLSLRKMFGLDRDYNGQKVQKVSVHIKPSQKKTKLKLIVNGRTVDREVAKGTKVVVLDPRRDLMIGRDISSLKLKVNGKAHIRRISIDLVEKRSRYLARNDYQKRTKYDPINLHTNLGKNLWIVLSNGMRVPASHF